MVLREVDRQICYEVSERFTLAPSASGAAPGNARLRTGVVEIRPTGAAGSGAAAIANMFIPGPGTIRVPGTTGGLAVESELVGPDGQQVALEIIRHPGGAAAVALDDQGRVCLLRQFRQDTAPDSSVLDLKAFCRGLRYVEETLKSLPQMPEPILFTEIRSNVTRLGRIHPGQTQAVSP
jgi:hypothetical protein